MKIHTGTYDGVKYIVCDDQQVKVFNTGVELSTLTKKDPALTLYQLGYLAILNHVFYCVMNAFIGAWIHQQPILGLVALLPSLPSPVGPESCPLSKNGLSPLGCKTL
jgi:hypothetical protein